MNMKSLSLCQLPFQLFQLRPLQLRPLQLRPFQLFQLRPLQLRPLQLRPLQFWRFQLRPLKLRPLQLRPVQVRPPRFPPLHVRPPQLPPLHARPPPLKWPLPLRPPPECPPRGAASASDALNIIAVKLLIENRCFEVIAFSLQYGINPCFQEKFRFNSGAFKVLMAARLRFCAETYISCE
jgi:hypothetical protein